LLEYLDKPTFTQKFSIASNLGRIAATNKLMLGARVDWVRIFEAIGYLDAYMSIAQLMKQYGNSTTNPLCFAQFERASCPHIALDSFWNPFVDPGKAKVVVNSVELGAPARNMILTGPNTGGKSTVIKAIALNALLAQTFGIAAARSCQLTPFTAIRTYIRVEDDIERGLSLYRAEVERAKQLSSAVAALQPGQHALVIIDEMFRGTARDQAALLAYWYAKENLGRYPHCMLLEATHYPELIGLEKETNGLFQNYKVEIERNSDGSLRRTYLLKKGSTLQNVAADILKEEGFHINVS
jgi:DNA mismatch repair protein MutS